MTSKIKFPYQPYKPRVNLPYYLDVRTYCPIRKRAPWFDKYNPFSLEDLCAVKVNTLPTVDCWNWSAEEVGDWIEKTVGFPQYRECFVKNYITGRKLITVDASTLPQWNIKDFDDIKKITSAIRKLLNIEPENWARSIVLPPREPETLFLMYKQPTGIIRDRIPRTNILQDVGYLTKDRPKQPKNMWDRTKYEKPKFPKEKLGLWSSYKNA